jgi:cytochrome P450
MYERKESEWSMATIPAYDPISSVMIDSLYYVDTILNSVFELCNIPWNNLLGGDLYDFADKSLLPFILELIKTHPKEKAIFFRLGYTRLVIVNDIDLTRKILLDRNTKRDSNYARLSEFFGYGIFTSIIEDRWHHQRNIILRIMSKNSLKGSEHAMWNKTIEIIEMVKGETIDLPRFLTKVGLILFCDLVLNIDIMDMCGSISGNETDKEWTLTEDIEETLHYINGAVEPIQNKYSARYEKFVYHRDKVHKWMREVISRVRNSDCVSNKIIIDEFLNGDTITDEMVELMISIVLGGHETTARLMTGTIYSILNNPLIVKKIRSEDSINKTGYSFATSNYIDNVVNEGLRLYPPVWIISRDNPNTLVHENISIPGGTLILLSPLIIQRNQDFWGSDAEVFRPERFHDKIDSKRYFPFIVGRESCPGNNFARLESTVIIQALFQNYNVEIIGNHTVQPYSRGTFRLTKNLPIRITSR